MTNSHGQVWEAAQIAERVLQEIHGIDISDHSVSDLTAVINCLFVIRRARLLQKNAPEELKAKGGI